MPVDRFEPLSHSAIVGLADAVDALLDGKTREWLSTELGVEDSTVSRLLSGHTRIRVDQVVALEETLKAPPGYLFRAMGLVPDDTTVEQVIESHPMSADLRRLLRAALRNQED